MNKHILKKTREMSNSSSTTTEDNSHNEPLVTIITVCRNASPTLEACVVSVAEQTYQYIEHIVIDGESNDGTSAILERHRGALALVVCEPDRGIYDAMNKGLLSARGEFILFLNADDRLVGPSAISDAIAQIARAPDQDIYYGSLIVIGDGKATQYDPPPPDRALQEMVIGCLPHQATFTRRRVFDRTGPFNLSWRIHSDYDWWLRVLGDPSIRLCRIRTVVAEYVLGGASSNLEKGQPEVYAIQNNAVVYCTPEWDRRRIEIYQQALLSIRVAYAKSSALLEDSGQIDLTSILRLALLRHLPRPAVRTIKWAKDILTKAR